MTVSVKLTSTCPNHVHAEITASGVTRKVVLTRDDFTLDLTDLAEARLRIAAAIKAAAGVAGKTTPAQIMSHFASGANVEV